MTVTIFVLGERGRGGDVTNVETKQKLYIGTTWSEFACQPISIPKAQSRKKAHKPLHTSWIFPKMCLAMFANPTFLYGINFSHVNSALHALFTWCCDTACAKDHRFFNYPQINEVAKSDHLAVRGVQIWTGVSNSCNRLGKPRALWLRQRRRYTRSPPSSV